MSDPREEDPTPITRLPTDVWISYEDIFCGCLVDPMTQGRAICSPIEDILGIVLKNYDYP